MRNFKYGFHPTTGVYTGIVRPEIVSFGQKHFPGNCTDQSPPWRDGFVPVWDFALETWRNVERGEHMINADLRHLLKEENAPLITSVVAIEKYLSAAGTAAREKLCQNERIILAQLEKQNELLGKVFAKVLALDLENRTLREAMIQNLNRILEAISQSNTPWPARLLRYVRRRIGF